MRSSQFISPRPSSHRCHGPAAFLLFIGLLFGSLSSTFALGSVDDDFSTTDSVRALQSQIIELIDDARKAVVGVEIQFRNRRGRPFGVAGGSGAIVDAEEGIILTAGHVGRDANLDVTIYLHDGTRLRGKTLGQHLDGQEDCGLIQIDRKDLESLDESDRLHELPIGDSSKVDVGDWVLVFGHTLGIEKRPWRPPPARFGRLTSVHDHVLTMDAPLNSGDSGGPMLNLAGEIIGINESCAMHPFENAASSSAVALKYYDAMLEGTCSGKTLPLARRNDFDHLSDEHSTLPIVFEPADISGGRHANDVRGVFDDAVWDASDWTLRLFVDGEQIGLGLVVDESGLLLAKSSELDPRKQNISVITSVGLQEKARVIARDPSLDLMLLQLPPGDWIPAPIDQDVKTDAGSWLVSAGPDAAAISFGIRGLDTYTSTLSDMDGAFLGVRSARTNNGFGSRITLVVPGSAARQSGLRVDDVLLQINDRDIDGPKGLVDVLSDFRVGDVIQITYERGGEVDQTTARFGSRNVVYQTDQESGNVLVPVSRRDTGFGRVIQHDSFIKPEQCGGPVVDLDGRFIGMNIARSDRTKIFALPAVVIRESLARMKRQMKTEKAWIAVDPVDLQIPLRDKDGVFDLHARDAQVFGPSARFSVLDEVGCILHWSTLRDEVLWVIDAPEPGAYEVSIEYACDPDGAGVPFTLTAGKEVIQAVTEGTDRWDDFRETRIGELEVGEVKTLVISIKPTRDPPLALMNLRSVELIPIID